MLILYDCDGVLVDSEIIAARVLRAYLEDVRFPVVVTEEEHDRFLGFSLLKVRETLEAGAGQALPDDFEDELRRRDAIAFEKDLRPIDGVHEAVRALPGQRCVASSGAQQKIRNSLTLTGLYADFAPYFFSAQDPDVARGKPAPDLFLHAARHMGFAPSDCVVIEDSVAGVRAGVAAGMRTIGFTGGSHCREGHDEMLLDAGAQAIARHMRDLTAQITTL